MVFECNIDARGQAHRMKLGIFGIIFSLILGSLTLFGIFPTIIGWIITGSSFAGASFAIWEARMGWCVIRAMGFKTKI
jgi:hypothetical protein